MTSNDIHLDSSQCSLYVNLDVSHSCLVQIKKNLHGKGCMRYALCNQHPRVYNMHGKLQSLIIDQRALAYQ